MGSKENCTLCRINPGYLRVNILPNCNWDGYFDDQCNFKESTLKIYKKNVNSVQLFS